MNERPAQSAPLPRTCPCCGADAVCAAGQTLAGGRIRWSAGGSCPACGAAVTEAYGWDPTPEDIRYALIRAHGEAVLRAFPDPEHPRPVTMLKAVREVFGVPLAEAKARMRMLGEEGEHGARLEMRHLAERLRRAGFRVALEGGDATGGRPPVSLFGHWPANPAAHGLPAVVDGPRRIGTEPERVELVPGSLPEDLRVRVAGHLAAGHVLVIAGSGRPDPLADGPGQRVPAGTATDGTWTWDLAWETWIRVRGCAPQPAFLAYVRDRLGDA